MSKIFQLLKKIGVQNFPFLFFLFLFYFLSFSTQLSFALQITQIDNTRTAGGNPSSLQFVEFYNETESPVDISGFNFFDAGAPDRGHSLSSLNTETNFNIPAKTYFIISSNPSRDLFKNCRVFKYSLAMGATDKVSFKKENNLLAAATVDKVQTLNSTNCHLSQNINDNPSTSTSSKEETNRHSKTNANSPNVVYVYLNNLQNRYGDIQVLLPESREVPALAEVDYTVKVIDSKKQVLNQPNISWSFGDGGERFGKDVSYHYIFPGEYTLIAQADGYAERGQAKMRVTVYEPKITITRVGTSSLENFVEIKNGTDYDVYLSNFYLKLDEKEYRLPNNFVVAKNSSVKISGPALGFDLPAINVSLLYPNRRSFVKYEIPLASSSQILAGSPATNLQPDPDPSLGSNLRAKAQISQGAKEPDKNKKELEVRSSKKLAVVENPKSAEREKIKSGDGPETESSNPNPDLGVLAFFKKIFRTWLKF